MTAHIQQVRQALTRPKPKDLHKLHPKQIVLGPFGPHYGKIMCRSCGVWVTWLTREQYTEQFANTETEIK